MSYCADSTSLVLVLLPVDVRISVPHVAPLRFNGFMKFLLLELNSSRFQLVYVELRYTGNLVSYQK